MRKDQTRPVKSGFFKIKTWETISYNVFAKNSQFSKIKKSCIDITEIYRVGMYF